MNKRFMLTGTSIVLLALASMMIPLDEALGKNDSKLKVKDVNMDCESVVEGTDGGDGGDAESYIDCSFTINVE